MDDWVRFESIHASPFPFACTPHTRIMKSQGGAAVASISGCDAPAILREVTKHMPPQRTSDDKEAEPE